MSKVCRPTIASTSVVASIWSACKLQNKQRKKIEYNFLLFFNLHAHIFQIDFGNSMEAFDPQWIGLLGRPRNDQQTAEG